MENDCYIDSYVNGIMLKSGRVKKIKTRKKTIIIINDTFKIKE